MIALLLAAALASATEGSDRVLTADGELVGTIVEESPTGVTIRLPDGTPRHVDAAAVRRIEYANGTVSPGPWNATPAAGPAPFPPPPPEPERPSPAAAPASEEPARARPQGWGGVTMGGAFLSGQLEPGVDVGRILGPQLSFSLDGGWLVRDGLGIGFYFAVGGGDPGSDVRAYCKANGLSCSAGSFRLGALVLSAVDLSPRVGAWWAVGTGFAQAHVSTPETEDAGSQTVLQYWGWEMVRLAGGVDLGVSELVRLGAFAGIGFIRYSRYGDAGGALTLPATSIHSVAELGLRVSFWR